MIANFFCPKVKFGNLAYLGDFVIHYDSTNVDMLLIQDFLSAPDHFFSSGESIKSAWKNKKIDKSVVKVRDKTFFIKRYNCLGQIYRIKNIFRKSNALKSWRTGWKFLQLGISTPRPIICIEERRFNMLGRSYLLCEFIDDAHNLLDMWPTLNDQKRMHLLYLAGNEIGNMHHKGSLHGDLNWRNILIQGKMNHEIIFLVDLDHCHHLRRINQKVATRDLDHFYRDSSRNNVSKKCIKHFNKSWQSAANFR